MAGRRPKSAALKLVTGNPGGRPVPVNEPVLVPGSPERPAGLGKAGDAEWARLVGLLAAEHRLSEADGPHLWAASKALATALDYERKARARGLDHGEWRRFKTGERQQWETYRKAINDLCLSQGTRARAKVGTAAQPSKIDQFLARRS